MEYSRSVNGVSVWARCEELVGFLAESLLDEFVGVAPEWRDGFTLQMGGGFYSLASAPAGWSVTTRDMGGDIDRDVTDDLSAPLRVMASQVLLLRECGLGADFVTAWDGVVVSQGWDSSSELFAVRLGRSGEGHSGWNVAPLEAMPPGGDAWSQEKLMEVPAIAVMRQFPQISAVLALPEGHASIVSEEGPQVVLRTDKSEPIWVAESARD